MSGPPASTILVERPTEVVSVVVLNRPEKRNALDREAIRRLTETLGEELARPGLRALVLLGAGRSFCAGQDLDEVGLESSDEVRATVVEIQDLARRLRASPTPVVAGVQGHAVGLGAELALCADVRIAAEDAVFWFPEASRALTLGLGSTWLLPRLVGPAAAADLVLTAEPLQAADASRTGLVSRLVPPSELTAQTLGVASRIASNAPLSVASLRTALLDAWSCSFEEALARELEDDVRLSRAKDAEEAVTAWRERREPVFRGR